MRWLERIRAWFRPPEAQPRPTLLEALTLEALPAVGNSLDRALPVAAYRFVRLGAVVTNADELSRAEIAALETARAVVERERALELAEALRDPLTAAAPLEGGKTRRRAALRGAVRGVARELAAEAAKGRR